MNAIIGIDFDGTICTHEFPQIGQLVPGAKETISALRANGHKVFLWTMRGYHQRYKNCLEEAAAWCEEHGIEFDGFNNSPSSFKTSSPKQHANLYIDDAALGCPLQNLNGHICVDWSRIAEYLLKCGYIDSEQYKRIKDSIYS